MLPFFSWLFHWIFFILMSLKAKIEWLSQHWQYDLILFTGLNQQRTKSEILSSSLIWFKHFLISHFETKQVSLLHKTHLKERYIPLDFATLYKTSRRMQFSSNRRMPQGVWRLSYSCGSGKFWIKAFLYTLFLKKKA